MKTKKLTLTALCFAAFVLFLSWNAYRGIIEEGRVHAETYSHSMKFFAGNHELRRFSEYVDKHGRLSGGFFLFAGSIDGEYKEDQRVKFAWKTGDGSYVFNSMPLERVRVKFDDTANTPLVQFSFNCSAYYDGPDEPPCGSAYARGGSGPQKLIDRGLIDYVTIICRPEDWQTKVQMPIS